MKFFGANVGYAGSFSAYWMSYCVIASFCSVFMLDNGYSNTEIGVLIALGNLLSVAIQPIIANIADRSKNINVFQIAILTSLIVALFESVTFLMKGKSAILFIAYIIMFGFQASIQPLLNSVAGKLAYRKIYVDYGICRAMGSMGYSVISAILSYLVIRFGTYTLPWVGEATIIFLIIFLLYLNRIYNSAFHELVDTYNLVEDNKDGEKPISMRDFIHGHRNFIIIMIGVLFIFYDHQIINFFQLQIFYNIGGNSGDMGRYYSYMTILELIPMAGFTWINRKFSSSQLLKLATLGLVLRAALMIMAKTSFTMMLTLIVHPIGFPLFLLAIVKFINEIMDEGEAVRGQALYVMMVTLSALIASATGGFILDKLGGNTLLWICLITSILGFVVIIPFINYAKFENISDNK